MKCSACNYDTNNNPEESNYEFWEMKDINFELQRQEFTDVIEKMDGKMFVCPKCFAVRIEGSTREVKIEDIYNEDNLQYDSNE
jgi:hypothetical protein